jgi:hypothetical protein
MNTLQDIFKTIDSRILDLDFSKLINVSYLTESQPDTFSFSGWILLFVLLNIVAIAIVYVLLKKRIIEIAGKRRIVIKKFLKINLILIILWMIFIFFRFQGFMYLSMRIWQLLLLIAYLVVNSIALVRYLRSNSVSLQKISNEKGVNYYQDYLPKKNKKRKH